MKEIFSFILIMFILSGTAYAFTVVPSGVQATISYTEPILNSGGSPLVDLDHTIIYWIESGTLGLLASGSFSVPATSVNGGGVISQDVIIPGILPGMEVDVDFWSTAFDESGNESGESAHVITRFDLLAPAPPQ